MAPDPAWGSVAQHQPKQPLSQALPKRPPRIRSSTTAGLIALGGLLAFDIAQTITLPGLSEWQSRLLTAVVGALIVAAAVDRAAFRAATRALRDREARLSLVMQQIPAILWTVNKELRFTSAVGAGLEALGLAPDELVGISIEEFFEREAQDKSPVCAMREAIGGASVAMDFEWRGRSFACSAQPLRTGSRDAAAGALALAIDVTDRKLLEEELTFRAFHDSLTGLANRSVFHERVSHALTRVARGENAAVIFLDLDDFKTINDSLGHGEGDHLLEALAVRLQSSVRTHDTVARFGGDEFAILLERLEPASEASEIIGRIEQALEPPIALRSRHVTVSASIGLAHAVPGNTAGEVLRNADLAMYQAKELGAARHVVFEPRMHAAVVDRLELEADLRRAIERDQLRLMFQPVLELETGEIQGFEALLRWEHPSRGSVEPATFIPLAEDTGLIVEIGRWVVEHACDELYKLHALGARGMPGLSTGLRMGINVASRQLQSDTFMSHVESALCSSGVDPNRVVLEITEGSIMHRTADTLHRLRALKSLGVQLAIDDFGTGYSSLSYLQRFPIDVLKVDKAFVEDVASGGSNAALTRTILALGDMLHLRTLAEGIETEEQCAELRRLGCKFGQGYFFSKPLEAWDVVSWAARHDATWQQPDIGIARAG